MGIAEVRSICMFLYYKIAVPTANKEGICKLMRQRWQRPVQDACVIAMATTQVFCPAPAALGSTHTRRRGLAGAGRDACYEGKGRGWRELYEGGRARAKAEGGSAGAKVEGSSQSEGPGPGCQREARSRGLTRIQGPTASPGPGTRLTRIQGPTASPGPGTQAHPDPGAYGLTRTRDPFHPDPGAHGLTRTRGQAHRIQGPTASPGPGTQAHPDPGAHGLTRTRDPGSPGSRGPRPHPDPGPRLTRIQGPTASPGPGARLTRIQGLTASPGPGARLTRIQGPTASPGPGARLGEHIFVHVFKLTSMSKLKLTSMENSTEATTFILLGLTDDPKLQVPLLLVFLFIYLITLVGNWGIMVIIHSDSHLHTPMYFFLSNLSFVDLVYSSAVAPKVVAALQSGNKVISYNGCAAQLFLFVSFATVEAYLLASMAYDRHAAICRPLHYTSTMTTAFITVENFLLASMAYDRYAAVCKPLHYTTTMTTVSIFYGTGIFMYLQPSSSHSMDTDKIASVFYTMVIPMLNPLVYSLRNKEVKAIDKRVQHGDDHCIEHRGNFVCVHGMAGAGLAVHEYGSPIEDGDCSELGSPQGWEATWRSGEGNTPITPLLLPLPAAQASTGPAHLLPRADGPNCCSTGRAGRLDLPPEGADPASPLGSHKPALALTACRSVCANPCGADGPNCCSTGGAGRLDLPAPADRPRHSSSRAEGTGRRHLVALGATIFVVETSHDSQKALMENRTKVTHFILLGLTNAPELQVPLFIMFTIIYLINVVGNLGMIALILLDSRLHTPMYFFLSNLSLVDFAYSSAVTPKVMAGLLTGNKVISYNACAAQMFIFVAFATVENYLLASMAYDRYAAVCKPLHYNTTMTTAVCSHLAVGSYICGFLNASFHIGDIFSLFFFSIFYGTVIFMYLQPSSNHSMDTDKVASVFYSMVIPMLNPLVYSLRNKEVKSAFKKEHSSKVLSLSVYSITVDYPTTQRQVVYYNWPGYVILGEDHPPVGYLSLSWCPLAIWDPSGDVGEPVSAQSLQARPRDPISAQIRALGL
ncbi:hypothetical protein QTO34_003610 [Cnephaeus nilssonii]|uniref:G-protein coupled receptors family 1 profile domain-containing protein n=1 Tax=Cnephaeus nilssonii TaxID=3371016 RepID=A0AA40HR54_CNENI|nr:hypothetical protein QTO34_003610 [Eptesicus nilssonii]